MGIRAFVHALITRIAIRAHLLHMQQTVALKHEVNIAGYTSHSVGKERKKEGQVLYQHTSVVIFTIAPTAALARAAQIPMLSAVFTTQPPALAALAMASRA